ncbi:DoxX family protein [Arenimonas sp.]|uniref:HvfX family Cu-binding RiPP maturation protein n=1 Tax=Arenimonas sp. TaxID=1872635 RepID=UPI002E35E0F3|nr:DoxX family protein [Arenimonas sp.]HEX4854601.1 DoxX family protein [Arenimonas sp.]
MRISLGDRWVALTERLDGTGHWLAPLGLRLVLAWEFWEAGMQKLRGENWFAGIQDKFPVPFNLAPVDLSWTLATWAELIGAVALLLGLGTRFFAFALLVLTAVATVSVHWPAEFGSLSELWRGYAITDKGFGNFKLPLLFALMLLPLVFQGGGKLSLDAVLAARTGTTPREPVQDVLAWGVALGVLGLPLALLVPTVGIALIVAGAVLVAVDRLLLA